MQSMYKMWLMTTLIVALGAIVSNPATLQAQEQTPITTTIRGSVSSQTQHTDRSGTTPDEDVDPQTLINNAPVALSQRDVECLAKNVYFESRGEGRIGMIAVAFVTVNRVEHHQWPDTVCDVVYQRGSRGGCAFSWTCDHIPNNVKPNDVSWLASLDIARGVLSGRIQDDPTSGSQFFHSGSRPQWHNVIRVIKLGHHIFYRLMSPNRTP